MIKLHAACSYVLVLARLYNSDDTTQDEQIDGTRRLKQKSDTGLHIIWKHSEIEGGLGDAVNFH